jgi:hypothetical protein
MTKRLYEPTDNKALGFYRAAVTAYNRLGMLDDPTTNSLRHRLMLMMKMADDQEPHG